MDGSEIFSIPDHLKKPTKPQHLIKKKYENLSETFKNGLFQ